jgi:hypothetical protein
MNDKEIMLVLSPFWKDEIMELVWQNWIKKTISFQSNCPFWLSPSVIFVVLKIFPREPMKNGCQQNHVSWSDLERQGHRVNLCPTSRGRRHFLSFRHQTQVQVWWGFPKKKTQVCGKCVMGCIFTPRNLTNWWRRGDKKRWEVRSKWPLNVFFHQKNQV